jgi:predicted dienelactone hydrolase
LRIDRIFVMQVRAIFRAIEVDDVATPFNVIHAKVYYPALDPETDEQRNSGILPPASSDTPCTVILFLNGINCPPESYAWLAHKMCEAGNIFVTFSWITDALPGGIHALTPGLDMRYMSAETYGKDPTGSAILPIIADLQKLNDDGLLAGTMDLDHIILGGHSAGGSVALTNAGHFPAVKGVFSYGAHTQGSTIMGFPSGTILPIAPDIPVLMLGGDNDGVIKWSARRYGKTDEDSSVSLLQTFEKGIDGKRGDRYLGIIAGGTHFTFADPQDATTGRPFLEKSDENGVGNRALMAEMIVEFINGNDLDSFRQDSRLIILERK